MVCVLTDWHRARRQGKRRTALNESQAQQLPHDRPLRVRVDLRSRSRLSPSQPRLARLAWPLPPTTSRRSSRPTASRTSPSIKPDPYPDFDTFAWRAFIALNWPSLTDPAHRGEPDRAKTLGDPGPRVWETFKARYELFQVGPDGRPVAPKRLGDLRSAEPLRRGSRQPRENARDLRAVHGFQPVRLLAGRGRQSARGAEWHLYALRSPPQRTRVCGACAERLEPGRKPAGSGPSRAIARGLDRGQSRVAASHRGGHAGGSRRAITWSRTPTSSTSPRRSPPGHTVCSKSDVALVGLHIVIRTKDRPQGLWSTFEHVDNVPPAGAGEAREPDARDAGAPYSYFDRLEAQARPLARRSARPTRCRSAWIIRPGSTPRPCRSCAGIRSIPRPWR